jgi:hypothetical protein
VPLPFKWEAAFTIAMGTAICRAPPSCQISASLDALPIKAAKFYIHLPYFGTNLRIW